MTDNIPYSYTRLIVTDEQLVDWEVSEKNEEGLPLGIKGTCPSCGHRDTRAEIALTLGASLQSGTAGRTDPGERVTRVVECQCGQPHPFPPPQEGAPPAAPAPDPPSADSATSCGRWWLVSVLLRPPPDAQPVLAGDEQLLTAARAARDAVLAEEKTIRTSAEKWVAGVAALVALLGLSGAVIGKDSLTGLPTEAKIVAVIFIVAAVAFGGAAVGLSHRAAYGWPAKVDLSDDASLRDWYRLRREKLRSAASDLKTAVLFATLAPIGLLVAAGVVWLWPRSAPEPLVIIDGSDGSAACGSLLTSSKNQIVRLRTPSGEVKIIEPGSIAAIKITDACRTQ